MQKVKGTTLYILTCTGITTLSHTQAREVWSRWNYRYMPLLESLLVIYGKGWSSIQRNLSQFCSRTDTRNECSKSGQKLYYLNVLSPAGAKMDSTESGKMSMIFTRIDLSYYSLQSDLVTFTLQWIFLWITCPSTTN